MATPPKGRNQHSDRPPFCDFLERYQKVYRKKWTDSQLNTSRVGMGRFDEWLKYSKAPLSDLNWQSMMEFYRFLQAHGISPRACKKTLQVAKHSLRWGIESGELPQKIQDIYTAQYSRHTWDIELPEFVQKYIAQIEVTTSAAHKRHEYSLKVLHTYLQEKSLTYKRMKTENMSGFLRFMENKKFSLAGKLALCTQVRFYIRWLYQNRHIKRHPDEIFPTRLIPKKIKHLPRPLDPEIDIKLQNILKETDDIIYKSILLVRRTGMRSKELQKLEFNCLEFDKKGRCSLKVPAVKLGLERRVPLDPETIKLVYKIQEMSRKNYKKSTEPKNLVIGPKGLPPVYDGYNDVMVELCARLDVRKWINLHALRHTYATSLLNAGLSIVSLKEILGHKSINMSLLYAKVTQEKIHHEFSDALKRLNSAQIPDILSVESKSIDICFQDLAANINKIIDQGDPSSKKALKGLLNRVSKIKSDLTKIQNVESK